MIDLMAMRKAQLKITRENLANIHATCDEMRERGIADIGPERHEELRQELLERERHLMALIENPGNNVVTLEEAQMCSDIKKFSRTI